MRPPYIQLLKKFQNQQLIYKERFMRGAEGLLSLVYPKTCFGCKGPLDYKSNIYLCSDCWNKIGSQMIAPFCMVCGRPIDIPDMDKCPECTGHHYFSRGYTASLYEGLVKDCIHSFKYNDCTYLAATLVQLMIDFFSRYTDTKDIDLLVPVPLHWRKFRQRGFNQAQLLAGKIGTGLGIPVAAGSLHRVRHVPSQTELARQERLNNIRGIFEVSGPGQFKGRRVLLIDDVFTTGATLNECSRVIMEAGAEDVRVFTLARGL